MDLHADRERARKAAMTPQDALKEFERLMKKVVREARVAAKNAEILAGYGWPGNSREQAEVLIARVELVLNELEARLPDWKNPTSSLP
jgi:transcriptional regulator with PAS, ATPase and Fis domain